MTTIPVPPRPQGLGAFSFSFFSAFISEVFFGGCVLVAGESHRIGPCRPSFSWLPIPTAMSAKLFPIFHQNYLMSINRLNIELAN